MIADKNVTNILASLDYKQTTQDLFISNNIWRAPIAACALGGLMVALFNLMSCIILVRCATTAGVTSRGVVRCDVAWRGVGGG